jgi:flagellar biogenesis protein FliO
MMLRGKNMERSAIGASLAGNCGRALSALGRVFLKAQAGTNNVLRIEETLSLGPKKMLYLVRCREKEFLIAAGSDAIVSVVEVSPAKPVAASSSAKTSLARMQKSERLS